MSLKATLCHNYHHIDRNRPFNVAANTPSLALYTYSVTVTPICSDWDPGSRDRESRVENARGTFAVVSILELWRYLCDCCFYAEREATH